MARWFLVAFAVLLSISGLASRATETPVEGDAKPKIAGKSLTDWVVALTPPPADLAWEAIPWHTSFSDGLVAADQARRPLLLWLMNGHPLGCT